MLLFFFFFCSFSGTGWWGHSHCLWFWMARLCQSLVEWIRMLIMPSPIPVHWWIRAIIRNKRKERKDYLFIQDIISACLQVKREEEMSGLICLQLHLVKPQILQSMTRYHQTEKSWFLMFLPPPPPRFSPLNFHSAYLNWSCFARTQAAESRIIELRELSLHPFYLSLCGWDALCR